MVALNEHPGASVSAAVQDLFASTTALASRLGLSFRGKRRRNEAPGARVRGKRDDPREWDRAAKRAVAAFAREQPPRRRALALALLRAATHTRRLLGIDARSRRRGIARRPGLSRTRRSGGRRVRTRHSASRDGPEPPGEDERLPSPPPGNGGPP